MLLYNQRKEFVGIDGDDLAGLGFNNIGELQNESHDFADLFVKKPGFIHNFKNFSWIDFILHSETGESKAIIHAKGKNYSCTLHVAPFYFTSDENGFAVIIKNLRALAGSEDLQATQALESTGGIQASAKPETTPRPSTPEPTGHEISLEELQPAKAPQEKVPSFDMPPEPEPTLPNFEESQIQELSEPEPLEIPEHDNLDLGLSPKENEFGAPVDIDFDAPLTLDDDIMMDETPELPLQEEIISPEPEPEPVAAKKEAPMLGDYVSSSDDSEHLSELVRSGTYVYEPQIAADELGLPVDLIEEFIGDFIDQAHEFHDDLYASVKTEDFDNVQILSHKLKGVAANLRVEDAFDVLSVVNTSKDAEEILPNLNQFYKIIAKLEGKELPEESAPVAASPAPEAAPMVEDDMDLSIDIKQPDDGPMLIDEDVTPVSHELPEDSPLSVDEDDLYGDLIAEPKSFDEPISNEPAPDLALDDDLYDDLLGTADNTDEPAEAFAEVPMSETLDDDIYGDLLGTEETPVAVEEQTTPSVEVPTLNIDENRTANELGIPVDIVKDFIQDFKEQVASHRADFDNALTSGNIKEVNKTATLLKGMSDNLRLNEISEVLKQLQQENNINNTAQALATLQAYADQL